MCENKCKNCRRYIQHYALNDRFLFQVNYGHCTLPEMRRPKQPDTKACVKFECRPSEENPFVTKEYLSKRLLEHVLNMDLLPEIIDPMQGCTGGDFW